MEPLRFKQLAVVVAFALAVLGANVLHHRAYNPDGLAYARFAARDAGYSEAGATLAARSYYEKTQFASMPRYRALVDLPPSQSFARSRIFNNRLLYPALVAPLLRPAGFDALFIVSAVAYVAFGIALFWFLTAFGRPWIAAALSIIALALPLTRDLAGSDLSDMLAAVWWAVSLGALFRLMRQTSPLLLAVLAIASTLLVLTRPTPYLIVLPAFVAAIACGAWRAFAASCVSILAFVLVAFATHAFSVGEQLRWVYLHDPRSTAGEPFTVWYRSSLLVSARYGITEGVRSFFPALLTLGAVFGVFNRRTRGDMLVLLTAIVACLLAIPFNPVPFSFPRVVLFPLVPVFCAVVQCFAASVPLGRRLTTGAAAGDGGGALDDGSAAGFAPEVR